MGDGTDAALYFVAKRHTGSKSPPRCFTARLAMWPLGRSRLSSLSHCWARRVGPNEKFHSVLAAVIAGGIVYTIYSEYVNTVLRMSWAYSAWMPTVPVLGTGIVPLAQWVVIPTVAVAWAARRSPASTDVLVLSRHNREHGCRTNSPGNSYKQRA